MRRNEYLGLLIFSLIIFLVIQCTPKILSKTISNQSILEQIATRSIGTKDLDACHKPIDYAPRNPLLNPRRTIRINVHFVNSLSKKHNFGPEQGRKFMRQLIDNANDRLGRNVKMNLPIGNTTEVLDPGYRLKLTSSTPEDDGFFFHYDDDLAFFLNKGKDKNNYNRDVIKKYAVADDTILNIFVLPHHPDSVATGRYKASRTGIALGTSLKIAGMVEKREHPWKYATLLNHEVGHVFGLRHSWYKNDGCDDTPQNANCWQEEASGKCKGPISNNMMDYNNSQMAITPEQLGKIHKNMASLNSDVRQLVVADWCELDERKTIQIIADTEWRRAYDLSHNIVIEAGASLSIKCRVSMPKGSSIRVKPGGKLILDHCLLHNDCGDFWKGIILEETNKVKGEVSYLGGVQIENVEENLNEN